jgi:hypothetical protein
MQSVADLELSSLDHHESLVPKLRLAPSRGFDPPIAATLPWINRSSAAKLEQIAQFGDSATRGTMDNLAAWGKRRFDAPNEARRLSPPR